MSESTEVKLPETRLPPPAAEVVETAALMTLRVLLAEDRSTEDRLAAIETMRPQLGDEATVHALCAMTLPEKSLEVRRALLGLLLNVDITRLNNRAPYIQLLLQVCATEPEVDLRLYATRALAILAPAQPELEELLAETLLQERSDQVNEAALVGLLRRPDKSQRTLELLFSYAQSCPPGLRGLLLQLFRQMQRPAAEAGLLAMLSAWEQQGLRAALLDALEELPSLSAQGGEMLLAYLRAEPMRELRAQVARILGALRDPGPGFSRTLLELLAVAPDGAELLRALTHKLDSEPQLLGQLAEMLAAQTFPARLKLEVLRLVEQGRAYPALTKALADANPWVRYAAIDASARHLAEEPEKLGPALIEAAQKEQLVELRARIASAFAQVSQTGRLSPAVQKFLVEWVAKEESPRISELLAQALPGVALTDETRAPLLESFLRVLRDPFAKPETIKSVGERLRAFAYRDEPVLIDCLRELLLRADTLAEAAEWYAQLGKLSPDAKLRAPILQTLLARFLGNYPADPTATWSRELHSLAPQMDEVRAKIPQLVLLTGETWMLSAADASDKKGAVLSTVRELLAKGKVDDAQRRIEEAWAQRALKKSDLLALFKRVLVDLPTEVGVFQAVVKILEQAKLASPEVQELCLEFLRRRPRSMMCHTVMQFLNNIAKSELGYGERVVASMTAEAYAEFCRTGDDPADLKAVPRTLNDWEYQGFRDAYQGWNLGELFLALSRTADVQALLAAPPAPGIPATHSLQAMLLHERWRKGDETAEELRALASLIANSSSEPFFPLRDRAFLLVWKRWKGYVKSLQGNAPPAELQRLAAETFLHVSEVRKNFGPESREKAPDPLPEMDLAFLESHWNGTPESLKELREKQLAVVTEARAKEILQLATSLSNKGKQAEAKVLLARLLGQFAETKLVIGKKEELTAYQAKLG